MWTILLRGRILCSQFDHFKIKSINCWIAVEEVVEFGKEVCPEVLKRIPVNNHVTKLSFDPKDDTLVKLLGFNWDPNVDKFSYHSYSVIVVPTKRAILSFIAKIYNPQEPISFWAKCFMQRLWKEGYDWDHPISEELSSSLDLFSSELPCVLKIKITRYIPIQDSCTAQPIGFSDALLKGYAAVVYLWLSYRTRLLSVQLLTAKSKVAPLKSCRTDEPCFVPRLELCGVLLLAQVLQHTQQTLVSKV